MDFVFNCPRCGERLSFEERGGEMRIGVLERIVERLAQFAPPDALSQADIERFREEIFADLQAKYPNAGLAKGSVPCGIPVPGKPDLVETPFSPGKYVDVSPFAPGAEVRDPYTGDIFRVPERQTSP
jgi:hypothetical protein